MKIIELQGENFKRMTAFDITPKGNVTIISGENGQGKTSVLDAIVMALAGKNSEVAKLTTRPIRAGSKTASVTVTTDTYVITRTWTEKDTYLEMTSRDGSLVHKAPQALLDSIIGDLCFDPLEFTRLKPKEQREVLLGIVKLGIDLDEWAKEYDFKYEERKSIGTQGKAIKGKLDTLPQVPEGTPEEEVSITDLMAKLQDHEEHNRAWLQQCDLKEKNEKMIAELEVELVQAREIRNTIDTRMTALKGLWPVEQIKVQLGSAEATNKDVRIKKDRIKAEADVAKYDEEYKKRSAELDAMENTKAKALQTAKFPIAGLTFSDDGVAFKQNIPGEGEAVEAADIPFAQLSQATQLKVSMAIAMAKNPKLRVIRITDGSLLDEKNMEVIKEMAEKNDFQIFLERVDSSGKVGVVIRDGEVVADNSEEAK